MLEAKRARANVYASATQALFEAWLQNGVCSKRNDSYYVFSQQKAKNEIKKLIEEQNYRSVKEIADQLKSPITLSDKSISKSLRVSFVSFARLVELALKQKVSLSIMVRNVIVKDLEEFIVNISNRKDIDSHRLELLRKVFKTWKTKPRKAEQTPKDYYSPSIGYYPPIQKKIIRTILEKGVESIKKKCFIVPREVLDEYLKVDWGKNIDELYRTFADNFEKTITLNQSGKLVLDIRFSGFMELDMNLDEYDAFLGEVSSQYGYKTSQTLRKVLDVDEEWADEVGKGPVYFKLDLISIPFEIKGGALLVDNVVMKDERSDEKIKLKYIEDRDKQFLILKSKLSKAWEQEDWNKVSEISNKRVQLEEDYELIEYCLDIVFKLFHKKHVVSFRAPEIIIRAWEAYGEGKLEPLGLEA